MAAATGEGLRRAGRCIDSRSQSSRGSRPVEANKAERDLLMPCNCKSYEPIELDRESINRRIKESKSIKKHLRSVAENSTLGIALLQCPECEQFWQSGHEWNFSAQEYFFQVPPIEASDWLKEPYRQPAAMMIFDAVMANFFARSTLEPTDKLCRESGCEMPAVRHSVHCKEHHIAALRKAKLLPMPPVGRLFPPYHLVAENDY